MGYSKKFKAAALEAPRTLGVQMVLWAIERDMPIHLVAQCLGTTRQTVYNWVKGKPMLARYRAPAAKLTTLLHDTRDEEWTQAWQKISTAFNLEPSQTQNSSDTSQ